MVDVERANGLAANLDKKRLTAGYATVGCHEIKSEGPLFNSMVTKHIALLKGRLAVGDL